MVIAPYCYYYQLVIVVVVVEVVVDQQLYHLVLYAAVMVVMIDHLDHQAFGVLHHRHYDDLHVYVVEDDAAAAADDVEDDVVNVGDADDVGGDLCCVTMLAVLLQIVELVADILLRYFHVSDCCIHL